jgi:hypothetical protein
MNIGNICKATKVENRISFMKIQNQKTRMTIIEKSKYCYICKIPGHTTEECCFNGKTNSDIEHKRNRIQK